MSLSPSPFSLSVSPSRLFRIAVAIALTALVLWKADPVSVLRIVSQADWRWVMAAVMLVLIDRGLMAWRWIDLLCAVTPGSRPAFTTLLRIFFVSTFVGSFIPGIGGDSYRAYSLSTHDVRLSQSAASVLMDRVLGALSIAILGTVALAFGPDVGAGAAGAIAIAIAGIGCAIVAAAVFTSRGAAVARGLANVLPWRSVQRAGLSLVEAVQRYSRHHGELFRVLLASLGVQVIRVLQAYCLGRSIAIDLPIATYFLLISIVLLVMLVPITISGLGTSQYAFDYLFGHAGVPSAQAVALSILFIALGIVGNLPGSVLYATGGGRPK